MTNGRSRSAKAVCAEAIESASRGPDRRTQRPPRKSRVGLGVFAAIPASAAVAAAWAMLAGVRQAQAEPVQLYPGFNCGPIVVPPAPWPSFCVHIDYGTGDTAAGGSGGPGGSGGGGGNGGPSGPIGPYVPEGPLNPDKDEERCGVAKLRIDMRRYLGPTWETSIPEGTIRGTLKDIDELRSRGYVPEKQRLLVRMSVRRQMAGCGLNEIAFKFNDETIYPISWAPVLGTPQGQPFELEFWVPTRIVRFSIDRGDRRDADPRPDPAINEFVAEPTDPTCLCVTLRDAEIDLRALSPVVLVHGIGGDGPGTFGAFGFDDGLSEKFVLFDNQLTQDKDTNRVANDATRLLDWVPTAAETFGAEHVHIVAHSKGGLDSRVFLAEHTNFGKDPDAYPRVVSLTTLSTPHNGSAMGDLVDGFWNDAWYTFQFNWYFIALPVAGEWEFQDAVAARTARLAGRLVLRGQPGYQDLRTGWLRATYPNNVAELRSLRGVSTLFWAIGSNADASGDWTLDASECHGMVGVFGEGDLLDPNNPLLEEHPFIGPSLPSVVNIGTVTLWNSVFQLMSRHQSLRVVRFPDSYLPPVLMTFPHSQLMPNDCVVTQESAFGVGSFDSLIEDRVMLDDPAGDFKGRDHSAMIRKSVAEQFVVPWIIESDARLGGLRP